MWTRSPARTEVDVVGPERTRAGSCCAAAAACLCGAGAEDVCRGEGSREEKFQRRLVGAELRAAKHDKKINLGQLWNFLNKFWWRGSGLLDSRDCAFLRAPGDGRLTSKTVCSGSRGARSSLLEDTGGPEAENSYRIDQWILDSAQEFRDLSCRTREKESEA